MTSAQDIQEDLSIHLSDRLQSKGIFQKFVFFLIIHADGSHLPIKCPNDGAKSMKQYLNFKGFYSVALMSLVDAEYSFIWASVGAPVNKHDSTLLQSTDLWKIMFGRKMIPNVVQQLEDI